MECYLLIIGSCHIRLCDREEKNKKVTHLKHMYLARGERVNGGAVCVCCAGTSQRLFPRREGCGGKIEMKLVAQKLKHRK